ncbi:MAG: hypothetical protein M9924_16055 [Rhizobiaceae bacterium]|nr:hypothetical protein [Rhizobiaceae bacterium]
MRLREIGLHCDCPIVGSDCIIQLSLLVKDSAAIEMRKRKFPVDRDRSVKRRESFIKLASRLQEHTKVVMSRSIARPKRYCAANVSLRLRVLIENGEDRTKERAEHKGIWKLLRQHCRIGFHLRILAFAVKLQDRPQKLRRRIDGLNCWFAAVFQHSTSTTVFADRNRTNTSNRLYQQ